MKAPRDSWEQTHSPRAGNALSQPENFVLNESTKKKVTQKESSLSLSFGEFVVMRDGNELVVARELCEE